MDNIKEKLIELLRNATKHHEERKETWILNGKVGERPGIIESFADHLIANGVTIQKWIPSYEYPEETGFYICLYKSPYEGLWKVGQCLWNGTNWTTVGFMPLAVPVKQYMHLPEPPKGD